MYKPNTLRGKMMMFLLGFLILAVVISAAGAGFQALGSSSAKNGGLHNVSGYTVANGVTTVQIWNGTTWESAAFTASGDSVTVTVPYNFTLKEMLVFTANDSMDGYHLLSSSAFYQNMTVGTSGVGKMTNATAYLAAYDNSSATSNFNDKRIVSPNFASATIYSASTNNIGKNVAFNVGGMFASLSLDPQYMFTFNGTATNGGNATVHSAGSVVITQQFKAPFSFNLFNAIAGIALVVVLLDVVLMGLTAIPRIYQPYEHEYGEHEILFGIIALMVAVFEAVIVEITLGFGYGGIVDVGIGFTIGALLYTFRPGVQNFGYTGLAGVIGGALFAYVGAYMPTGNQFISMATSNELIGQLVGYIGLAFLAVVLIVSVYWTKVPDSE